MFSLGFKEQRLQCLVEFPNRLVFSDSHVALEPLYIYIRSDCHGIRELGLAASRWSLNQEWLLHTGGEIHHRKGYGIDDVSCGPECFPQVPSQVDTEGP